MSDQTPPPSDFQVSLGEVLKNRRIALGRSIEQLSALTRIHSKTLKALEENQYSELPARAFTRGFIVSYAKALGLSGEELVRIYQSFLEEKFNERPSKDKGHEGYAFESKEKEQNRRWLIVLGSVAALFAVVVLLFFKPQNHKRKEKHKEFTEEATMGTPVPNEDEVGAEGLPVVAAKATPTETLSKIATAAAIESAIGRSTPTPVSSSLPSVMASIAPVKPSPEKPKPSPTPASSATPAPSPTAVASATPTASASPDATAASPTPAQDNLNKGDDLKVNEVKKRVSFEATADTWVRYQADDKKPMILMLRKGKFLVIKAKQKIQFDTKTPENLKVRPRNSSEFKVLELKSFEISDDGALNILDGGVKGLPATP